MISKLRVLKFGGSSLATPEQIKSVAKKIADLREQGISLIVVTSAMGKTTDDLTRLAYNISSHPNRRELDMLLTTGERISMALMSMCLHDLNCPAISFTGSQAGIMTDGSFSNAKIKELRPIRVEEALSKNQVVVLAGFQGVDPISKEITTLGRGGSDTTAIAMAAHFGAERCEILKDVDGVFSADPKLVRSAKLYKKLPIEVLQEFCFWGAKVLNYRSVELAKEHHVPLYVGRSDNFEIGTEITDDYQTFKEGDLLGVNSHSDAIEISVACSDSTEGENSIKNILNECLLPELQILSFEFDHGTYKALATSDPSTLRGAREAFRHASKAHISRDNLATITASFYKRPCEIHIVTQDKREATIQKYF
ncbi:MAG: aspartate kinase [Bdellovibrionales bacterium]|nr:aspartate kinase [Bdellovibrionales bacterium]